MAVISVSRASQVAQWQKKKKKIPLTMQEMQVQSLGWEDSLEKERATHSNILAWKIPWTERATEHTYAHRCQYEYSKFGRFMFFRDVPVIYSKHVVGCILRNDHSDFSNPMCSFKSWSLPTRCGVISLPLEIGGDFVAAL